MLKTKYIRCYSAGCRTTPSIICKCLNPFVFSCPYHIEKHLSTNERDHAIAHMSTKPLEGLNKRQAIENIKKILSDLTEIANKSTKACNEIISQVNACLKIIIDQMLKVKSVILEASRIVLNDRPVDANFAKALITPEKFTVEINNKEILEKISSLFIFEPFGDTNFQADNVLYSRKSKKGLKVVNLTTFKSSTFPASKKNWFYSSACLISRNKYFITGGWDDTNFYRHTSIINLNNNTEEVLPVSSSKSCKSGCVYQDNNIYLFGGSNGSSIVTAEKFDLINKKWTQLPNLPIASHASSTLIDNEIVIVGFYLTYAYVFENNKYTQNLALPSNNYIACEKWIFTYDALYECLNLRAIQWNRYTVKCGSCPTIWAAHKKEQYIYFMNNDGILWRINLDSKTAAIVSFT